MVILSKIQDSEEQWLFKKAMITLVKLIKNQLSDKSEI